MQISNLSEQKRILLVSPQPFYQDRGTPIAIRHVIEALSARDYKVDLLTFPIGADVALPGLRIIRSMRIPGIRQVPIGLSLRKLLLDIALFATMFRILRKRDYWCVHAVEEAVFPALLIARRRGIPVLYDMQSCLSDQLRRHALFGRPFMQRLVQRLECWALRTSSVVVGSAGLAPYVGQVAPNSRVHEWNFPGQRPQTSASAIDRLRREYDLPHDARIILYSGNFARYQGVATLIEAIPAVVQREPRAIFMLVGAEPETTSPEVTEAMASAPRNAVRILPRQPRESLPSFLALADVLVSPREGGDNLPLKIFDYMAVGKPIVATDYPIHRTVLDEDRAVLVPPTAEAMADGIVSVLGDHRFANRLGSAAQAYSNKHLGLANFQRFVERVYGALAVDLGPTVRPAP